MVEPVVGVVGLHAETADLALHTAEGVVCECAAARGVGHDKQPSVGVVVIGHGMRDAVAVGDARGLAGRVMRIGGRHTVGVGAREQHPAGAVHEARRVAERVGDGLRPAQVVVRVLRTVVAVVADLADVAVGAVDEFALGVVRRSVNGRQAAGVVVAVARLMAACDDGDEITGGIVGEALRIAQRVSATEHPALRVIRVRGRESVRIGPGHVAASHGVDGRPAHPVVTLRRRIAERISETCLIAELVVGEAPQVAFSVGYRGDVAGMGGVAVVERGGLGQGGVAGVRRDGDEPARGVGGRLGDVAQRVGGGDDAAGRPKWYVLVWPRGSVSDVRWPSASYVMCDVCPSGSVTAVGPRVAGS